MRFLNIFISIIKIDSKRSKHERKKHIDKFYFMNLLMYIEYNDNICSDYYIQIDVVYIVHSVLNYLFIHQ